ncbi:MAG: amino acid synthesis family protein [Pseudomonadota bacterium]
MDTSRKTLVIAETVNTDAHGKACDPVQRVAALGIVKNPLAGAFHEDLTQLFEIGAELGAQLVSMALAQLTKPVVSYGKAAIVGVNGDMEHGGALIHPRLGAPMRSAIGGGGAVIPSNVKIGGAGASIDLPLGHKDNPWSFDHFDTMSLTVADAPLPDEIVMCVAFADGGRPIPRCGRGPVKA